MAVKKSEIYSSLWQSCDALRGGMDASQYKDYVLVLLFVKYVSDRYANDPDGLLDVPQGGSFSDMVALRGDKDIGEKINVIIANLAQANDLKGVSTSLTSTIRTGLAVAKKWSTVSQILSEFSIVLSSVSAEIVLTATTSSATPMNT